MGIRNKEIALEDPDSKIVNEICNLFVGAKITLNYSISFKNGETKNSILNNCNIIGDCLEDIIFPCIKNNIASFQKGPKQSSPDFVNRDTEFEWELKAFTGNPCFDISNFMSYVNQLASHDGIIRKLYKTKYLIFRYSIVDDYVRIDDFTMKSIWEIVRYDKKYPLSLQNKRGMWYNIRPCSMKDMKLECMNKTPEMFINKICEAILQCPNSIDDRHGIIKTIKKQYNDFIMDMDISRMNALAI